MPLLRFTLRTRRAYHWKSWVADLAPLGPVANATVMPGEIVAVSFASPAGERSTAIRTRCPKRCVLVAQADQLARHLLDVA